LAPDMMSTVIFLTFFNPVYSALLFLVATVEKYLLFFFSQTVIT
jgi:hypothetical protein